MPWEIRFGQGNDSLMDHREPASGPEHVGDGDL
jgi:hypothetical protein